MKLLELEDLLFFQWMEEREKTDTTKTQGQGDGENNGE